MRLVAKHTIRLGDGHVAPGEEFDLADKAEAERLIESGAAERKTRHVDDDDDARPAPARGAAASKS